MAGFLDVAGRRQAKRCAAWAAAHGFAHVERDDGWVPWFDQVRKYSVGTKRHADDVVSGPFHGRPATCFTYSFTTTTPQPGAEGGNSSDRHRFAVHTLALPAPAPVLRVGRPTFRGTGTGGGDAFAARYEVATADGAFAAHVLTPQVRGWLVEHDAPGFAMHGERIAVSVPGRLDVDRIERWLGYLATLVSLLPPY